MAANRRDIARSFDDRAATYARNEWHLRSAERLVALCALQRGDHVLDAATGTGFAALAAARAVGDAGRVVGVDISPKMLEQARDALAESGHGHVAFQQADAVHLSAFADGSFDAVLCAAGLLYMPIGDALREWHRLLKPGGRVAFSSMAAGQPPPARIFRDCAASFGIALDDPSEPLGSQEACRSELEGAGFTCVEIVSEPIEFSAVDLTMAWESNVKAAGNEAVRGLSAEQRSAFKQQYMGVLAQYERESPDTLRQADVLYALGRR